MASKFEQIINQALKDPKQIFFKKHNVSDKNIQLIREAKEKSMNKNNKKTKTKSKTLLARARKQNDNNTTLLGG